MDKTAHKPVHEKLELVVPTEQQKKASATVHGALPSRSRFSCFWFTSARWPRWAPACSCGRSDNIREERMTDQGENEKKQRRSNATIAVACLSFFVCMIGAAYASVPLYRIFCQVTGYGGTTQRVEQYSDTILDKTIKVRFDANIANGLPWDFKPMQREVTVRIGETTMIKYEAHNLFGEETYGRASFNVAPGRGLFQQGRVLLLYR